MFSGNTQPTLQIQGAIAAQQPPSAGNPSTTQIQQSNIEQLNQNILLNVQAINNLGKTLASWFH